MLLGLSLLSGVVEAQTANTPEPPTHLCINNRCTSAASTGAAPSTHTIKWNPGHYMASNSIIGAGDTISKIQSEMDDINGWNNILGYRVFITWGAIEQTQGVYNFAVLDSIFNRLKTQYNQPKRMVVVVLPGTFSGTLGSNDYSTLPAYLQNGSQYGVSPNSGSYGWWGQSTGAYVAALYRPAVMARWVALLQALGAHYDSDPYFEALMIQEDSWMIGAWLNAPDFSQSTAVTELEQMLTSATAAFPHTSVIMENTWLNTIAPTMGFETWMVGNRVAPGSSDTFGETAFADYSYATYLAWGLQAYCGISDGGVTAVNLRPKTHAMMDIEAPDIAGPHFAGYGGPYTPLDIVNSLNQTYMASHAFWTHLFGTENVFGGTVPTAAIWANLAATVSANPLTNTSYPANYP